MTTEVRPTPTREAEVKGQIGRFWVTWWMADRWSLAAGLYTDCIAVGAGPLRFNFIWGSEP